MRCLRYTFCMDDLTDEVDLAIGAGRLWWKAAGANTVLLGVVFLIAAAVDYHDSSYWYLRIGGAAMMGLAAGWAVDLLIAIAFRPLAKLAGWKAVGWKNGLLLGIPFWILAGIFYYVEN